MEHGRSHSSILPPFLLADLPPGWTMCQKVGFPLVSLLWISWDHQSCSESQDITHRYSIPMNSSSPLSATQLTSQNPWTQFLKKNTRSLLAFILKDNLCYLCRIPPLITQFDKNQKHMTASITHIIADTCCCCATCRRRGTTSAKGITGSTKLLKKTIVS